MLNCNDVWQDVVGFEGLYTVSSAGAVVSSGAYIKSRKGVPLKANPTGTSKYLYVKLWKNGKMYNRSVHRLVAQAFVENPGRKPTVNHKDGDKTNNNAANLEWVTLAENLQHAYATGLMTADHVAVRNRGRKMGRTSKFHNVSWDASRGCWKAALKEGGRAVFQKRFYSETDAAEYVNKVLDELGLTNRPRNIIA